jgi:signal peptidase II
MYFAPYRRWIFISAAVLALDQLSKNIVARISAPGDLRELIPGVLNFVHVRNTGVAFSIFAQADPAWVRPALILFALATSALLIWLLAAPRKLGAARIDMTRFTETGFALILGGALGNLADRLLRGSVLDFVDLHAGAHHWPAFNVADSAITIGAVMVLWELLFSGGRPRSQEPGTPV